MSRELVSTLVASKHLGVSEKTVRRYISQGRLTGYRVGRRLIRIDLAELDALLKPIPTAKAG
jgi:excisionase family DNA binding protein